jgi:phasin family protein
MADPRPEKTAQEAVQDTTRKMTEETGRVTRAMADAGERAGRANVELLQSNAETIQKVLQSGSELASELTARSTDQFARALGLTGHEAQQATQQSSRNMALIAQSSTVLANGMQNISTEWFGFVRKRAEQNIGALDALMRCRTPQELMALQSDLIRDGLQDLIQSTRKIAEVSVRMTDEASRKMAEAGSEAARRAA